MRSSTVMGFLVCAIVAAPTYVMAAEDTTGKVEQRAKGAAQDAKVGITDSWLTAKTKIALYGDDRVKGGQVSVETVKGAVSLRGKVDSDDAKAAAGAVAQAVEGVKSAEKTISRWCRPAIGRRSTSRTRTSRARWKAACRRMSR